jgi:hypothetical protein
MASIVALEDSSIKMNNVTEARLQDSLKKVALLQQDTRVVGRSACQSVLQCFTEFMKYGIERRGAAQLCSLLLSSFAMMRRWRLGCCWAF